MAFPASAEPQPQPIYIMAKPPAVARKMIENLRRDLGISASYGAERFHATLVPLGEGRDLLQSRLERIRYAGGSLSNEPFDVVFDRVQGNALAGGRALGELRTFQKNLVDRLMAFGVFVSDYDFHPHLSLTYGAYHERNIAIPAIRWTVEEILLVRSIHGEGRHELLHRWHLTRKQDSFDF